MTEEPLKPLRALVFGGGSLGALYSWMLTRSPLRNVHVTAVCRSNYADVCANGYVIKSDHWGHHVFRPHRVVRGPADIPPDELFDYIIVATKVQNNLLTTPPPLAAYPVNPEAALVLIQNGTGVEEPYRKAFPQNTIISAVAYVTVMQPTPGEIVHSMGPNRLLMGLYDKLQDVRAMTQLQTIVDALKSTGVDCILAEKIQHERWMKLLWNGPWNTLCAVTGLSTHDVLHSTPEVANLILEMVREIAETAKAHDGIEFDEKTKEWQIARTYDLPSIVPSMLQDAQKGVEMEVEGLCGNIWRKAEALGVQTPRVKSIYTILLAMNYRFKLNDKI